MTGTAPGTPSGPAAGSSSAELVEVALDAAAPLPAVVLVEETSYACLRWARNGLTTNGVTDSRTVTVIVTAPVPGGTAAGVLSRQGLDAAGVRELVVDAAAQARQRVPAEDAAPLVAGPICADWTEPARRTGPGVLGGVAEQLGAAFGAARAAGREHFGFAEHRMLTTWLGTSAGLRFRHARPRGTIELNGKADARARSAWVGRTTGDFRDVDIAAMDAEVTRRLDWQRRRVEVSPGRYPTVLSASAVADLMIYLHYSSDARSAHEGRSAFSRPDGGTRIGEQISGHPLTLSSDPAGPGDGPGCSPRVLTTDSSPMGSVFDNGLPCPPTRWIDGGRLAALPTTRHTAALTGLPVAPPAEALALTGPAGSGGGEAELVSGLADGLLLTCLWYIREVDPATMLVTGLTRDGVYVVSGGEVIGSCTNFRFNDSPVDLLGRTLAVGPSAPTLAREFGEWPGSTLMPPLLVDSFHLTGISDAV